MNAGSEREESWLPVLGYEGFYEVSDLGRVRSVNRMVHQENRWASFEVLRTGIVLRIQISQKSSRGRRPAPYGQVNLYKEGKGKTHLVHRLVLAAFAGACPEGREALHGEHGSLDNRWPENLSWGIHSDNMGRDKYRDGTMPDVRHENHPQAKLSFALAELIRVREAGGWTRKAIASDLGVSTTTVGRVLTGASWNRAA